MNRLSVPGEGTCHALMALRNSLNHQGHESSLRKTLREHVVSLVVLVRRRVQRQPCDPLGLPVWFVGFLLEMRS